MIKKETFELLQNIQANYNRFEITQKTIDVWCSVLKDYEFEDISANLTVFIKRSKFAPVLADLIEQEKPVNKAIPTPEETKAYLDKLQSDPENDLPDEVGEQAKKEIREMLRGTNNE